MPKGDGAEDAQLPGTGSSGRRRRHWKGGRDTLRPVPGRQPEEVVHSVRVVLKAIWLLDEPESGDAESLGGRETKKQREAWPWARMGAATQDIRMASQVKRKSQRTGKEATPDSLKGTSQCTAGWSTPVLVKRS